MPLMAGRRAVVTDGTGDLGFELVVALAAAGAEVVFVGADADAERATLQRLRGRASPELVRFEQANLADVASVRALGARLLYAGGALDLLINNAEIVAPPQRQVTGDGVEAQFQVNYLSHFLLTGLLLPRLLRAARGRVVNVTSAATRPLDFDDLQSEKYDPFTAYGRSKTAMLMFALALQRRAASQGWRLGAYAAHPGWAQTGALEPEPVGSHLAKTLLAFATPLFGQPAVDGALPILYAAAEPSAHPGCYAPAGMRGLRGWPRAATAPDYAQDTPAQDRLWSESEALTGEAWAELAA